MNAAPSPESMAEMIYVTSMKVLLIRKPYHWDSVSDGSSMFSWYQAGNICSTITTQKKMEPIMIIFFIPNFLISAGVTKLPAMENRYSTAYVVKPRDAKFLERIWLIVFCVTFAGM